MHRLNFKYDYQAAILENQLRAITPELRPHKKKIGDRPFDFINQGRFFFNFLFFRRPQNKACVHTRTMQTSIESTPWPT
jgi:hypothetical protein